MAKGEISWKTQGPAGEPREIYVHHLGGQWLFYHRAKRFDRWEPLERPSYQDWRDLLDAVRRRIQRRRMRPEAEAHVRRLIDERFPEVTE